jgi:hypothetical protein
MAMRKMKLPHFWPLEQVTRNICDFLLSWQRISNLMLAPPMFTMSNQKSNKSKLSLSPSILSNGFYYSAQYHEQFAGIANVGPEMLVNVLLTSKMNQGMLTVTRLTNCSWMPTH